MAAESGLRAGPSAVRHLEAVERDEPRAGEHVGKQEEKAHGIANESRLRRCMQAARALMRDEKSQMRRRRSWAGASGRRAR